MGNCIRTPHERVDNIPLCDSGTYTCDITPVPPPNYPLEARERIIFNPL
jgi:hypothetical protein